MIWDSEEDIFSWAECRVSRFYWLSHMRGVIEKAVGKCPEDLRVRDFFVNHFDVLSIFKKNLVEGSSCILDCKALCCYSSRDHSTQIPITRHEVDVLRKLVAEEGGVFEDYYTMVPVDGLCKEWRDYLDGLHDFFFYVNGAKMVCMLKPSDRVIDIKLLWDKPRSVKKSRKLWIDEKSCACRFLNGDNKCVLYDKLRFTVCREFYCLPAITVLVLRHIGLADSALLNLSMREMNLLSREVARSFSENKLLDWERDFDLKFRELAIAYVRSEDVEKRFNELKNFEREYESTLKARLGMKLTV